MSSSIIDKYIGTLLGGCCGDVLGSQTEGMTRTQIVKQFGDIVTELPASKLYTDDTEMTIVLARHLLKNKRVDFLKLHTEYANEMRNKGYSLTTRNILTLFKEGKGDFLPAGSSSTNGAVMRIAPLGFLDLDTKQLLNEIRSAIYFTHGNSEDAHASAFLHCKIIRALITNKFNNKQELFTYILGNAKHHPPLWTKINLIKYCLYSPIQIESITEELLGNKNAMQIQSIDAICCAIYIFLCFYENPLNAVCYAASMGGDTDTIAKLVGEMCGALYGKTWIPTSWHSVENENELIELGRQFAQNYNT